MNRRQFLGATMSALTVLPGTTLATGSPSARPYRRIACEEGFLTPAVVAANGRLGDIGIPLITSDGPAAFLAEKLTDIGEGRIADMDRDGIDMQLLMISAPGLQVFEADEALALSRDANDQVSEACKKYPDRFAALAAIAPQAPEAAAKELDRAVTRLGLKGAVINSHTNDRYLDEPGFSPILAAAEALGVPIYIHPRDPVSGISRYMTNAAVSGATWAYAVEVGTHVLRMIGAGVFDRFPRLRIVIGHMGEGLPFWLPRIDNRFQAAFHHGGSKLELLPSEYVRRNFHVTTSGMNYWPQLKMTVEELGADKVLYATDYPFEDQGATVAAVEAMPLDNYAKTRLFETNARRVFNL